MAKNDDRDIHLCCDETPVPASETPATSSTILITFLTRSSCYDAPLHKRTAASSTETCAHGSDYIDNKARAQRILICMVVASCRMVYGIPLVFLTTRMAGRSPEVRLGHSLKGSLTSMCRKVCLRATMGSDADLATSRAADRLLYAAKFTSLVRSSVEEKAANRRRKLCLSMQLQSKVPLLAELLIAPISSTPTDQESPMMPPTEPLRHSQPATSYCCSRGVHSRPSQH
ncbi:hypothetical protein LIA77_12003 [Sarocladium implicatum]|nr:hypothetical protein LIA77_12003 [Sarocladium implicatum]